MQAAVALVSMALVCSASSTACRAAGDATNELTHGVAVGAVTPSSAVIWARCGGPADLRFVLAGGAGAAERTAQVAVAADHDFVGKALFDGLAPETTYEYAASCAGGAAERGSFRTAPPPDAARPLRLGWSGDVGGQNVCRDAKEGYAVFDLLRERKLDLFVGVGDMMYADDPCKDVGRYRNAQIPGPPVAVDLEGFWAHWRYNRIDPASRRFFASTPYWAVWDDHEIKNDAGPENDILPIAPGRHLLPPATQSFVDYQPMLPETGADGKPILHSRVRWGRHVELFLLDTRQYRDSNLRDDDPKNPKTIFGKTQREWLLDGLAKSDATWRIVVCSVPFSIPTGSDVRGRDGFADGGQKTGFENEALAILRFLRERGIRNHLWITTDVHFANVFRYAPFADDPSWRFHEVTAGPLTAGVFPRLELDETFRPERLFMHGPADPTKIASYDEAKHWFNFGVIDVATNGDLTLRIVTAKGETVYELALPAAPAAPPAREPAD